MDFGCRGETSRRMTAQEEALRRNTDCVYFLASPLTCKKGIKCEFRHIESVRFNPRDCWYWLQGHCSNPRCYFRHLPLDWLYGCPGAMVVPTETPQLSGFSATTQVSHAPAAYNIKKQKVPCCHFRNGHCIKGAKCAFMHEQKPSTSIQPSEIPCFPAKPFIQAEIKPDNGFAMQQSIHPFYDGPPRLKSSNFPLCGGDPLSHPQGQQLHSVDKHQASDKPQGQLFQSVDEHHENDKEPDELLGESSPGFDVLVNNHIQDSDYFQKEDESIGTQVRSGRNLNLDDFRYRHPDYDQFPRSESKHYNKVGKYDLCTSLQGREHHRRSSGWVLDRPLVIEKRMFWEESCDELDHFDLRHQLTKKRRQRGWVSYRSSGQHQSRIQRDGWYSDEERSHAHRFQMDRWLLPRERCTSSCLKCRIAVPTRYSQDQPIALRSQIAMVGENNQRGSSQTRLMNYNESIRRRPNDSSSPNARKSGADSSYFAGPRRLAQSKGAKAAESCRENILSSNKAVGYLDYGASTSSGSPNLSSVLPRRKRETVAGNYKKNADGDAHAPASVIFFSDGQCQCSSKAGDGGNIHEAPHIKEVDEEDKGYDLEDGELLDGGNIHEAPHIKEVDEEDKGYDLEDGELLDGGNIHEAPHIKEVDEEDKGYDLEDGELLDGNQCFVKTNIHEGNGGVHSADDHELHDCS